MNKLTITIEIDLDKVDEVSFYRTQALAGLHEAYDDPYTPSPNMKVLGRTIWEHVPGNAWSVSTVQTVERKIEDTHEVKYSNDIVLP